MREFKNNSEWNDYLVSEGNKAIGHARRKALRNGFHNVYEVANQTVFQAPNGEISPKRQEGID